MTAPIIVTLTSIPPRFARLGQTLRTILAQSTPALRIELWVPPAYERFPGELPSIDLPEGVTLRRSDKDYGPATKVLPAARAYRDDLVRLAYCDDDILYTPDWLERMSRAAILQPDACIAECGFEVSHNYGIPWRNSFEPKRRTRQKRWTYRVARLGSLGLWKPANPLQSGFVDIAEGFGGVLVRPTDFPETAFDIPPIAMKADDIWLSGQLALNGVPIWLNALLGEQQRCTEADATFIEGLREIDGGDERHTVHPACVAHLQREFGVWGGVAALKQPG